MSETQTAPIPAPLTRGEKAALDMMKRCFDEYPDDIGLMTGTLDGERCVIICTRQPTMGGYKIWPQAVLLDDDLKNRIANCNGEFLPAE